MVHGISKAETSQPISSVGCSHAACWCSTSNKTILHSNYNLIDHKGESHRSRGLVTLWGRWNIAPSSESHCLSQSIHFSSRLLLRRPRGLLRPKPLHIIWNLGRMKTIHWSSNNLKVFWSCTQGNWFYLVWGDAKEISLHIHKSSNLQRRLHQW
jgi:hypothetical protein